MALFVKAGAAPTNPELIAEYTLVGNRKGTGITTSAPPVDLTDSDSAAGENTPGIPTHTISGTFNCDHAGDGGVTIMRTAAKTKAQIHWLLTPVDSANAQDSGKDQHYGTGSVSDFGYNYGHENASEVPITIAVHGQYTTDKTAT